MSSSFEYFIERHQVGQRTLLVNLSFPTFKAEDRIEEFKELARAADFEVINCVSGRRDVPFSKYFVGKGKADEILNWVNEHKIETVLFNHELTPAQGRNLEKLFNCRVMSRTELILDIFGKRAQTFEGKLQVELANLKHLTTRLVGGWTHLERQRGGTKTRGGAGEMQLEIDRRGLNQRIHITQQKLNKVLKQRKQRRKTRRRSNVPTVSLVGYTNAGKSTLFNRLTNAHVYVENKLFATLDPTLRQLELPNIGKVVLADTVGFIRDLPHELVAAFRATLEETEQADLLLHVIDVTQEEVRETIKSVESVLKEIHADKVPTLQVYNKIDARKEFEPRVDRNELSQPVRVWISAQTGEGIGALLQSISELLSQRMIECCLKLSPKEGKLRAELYTLNAVFDDQPDENGGWRLHVKIDIKDYIKLIQP